MKGYRQNVAALVIQPDGRLLVCERLRIPGAWQFPQGGIDAGESPEEALARELLEEIGLPAEQYRLGASKGGYRYEFPTDLTSKKTWKHGGQEQRYFECWLHQPDPELVLDGLEEEFRNYQWIQPQVFQLSWLPDFKKDVYRQVMRDFFNVEIK